MAINIASQSGVSSFRAYSNITKGIQSMLHGNNFFSKAIRPWAENFGMYSPIRIGSQGRLGFRAGGTRGRWYGRVEKNFGTDFANEMLESSKLFKGSGGKFKLMSEVASGVTAEGRTAAAKQLFKTTKQGQALYEGITAAGNNKAARQSAIEAYQNAKRGYVKQMVGNKKIGFTKVAKTPFALKGPVGMAFATLGMTMELESEGLKGLLTGPARELGGTIGASIGMNIGGMFGPIGSMIGGIAGGMLGYQAIDIFTSMSEKGRQWSTPDMGGRFRDSIGAQTMRQRSLNAIRTSQFNIRSEMGNEALRIATGGF